MACSLLPRVFRALHRSPATSLLWKVSFQAREPSRVPLNAFRAHESGFHMSARTSVASHYEDVLASQPLGPKAACQPPPTATDSKTDDAATLPDQAAEKNPAMTYTHVGGDFQWLPGQYKPMKKAQRMSAAAASATAGFNFDL